LKTSPTSGGGVFPWLGVLRRISNLNELNLKNKLGFGVWDFCWVLTFGHWGLIKSIIITSPDLAKPEKLEQPDILKLRLEEES
jgi:hypothetical protein